MRNASYLLLVAACAAAWSACASGPRPTPSAPTPSTAAAPTVARALEVDDAVALRWAIAWWTESRSRVRRLAAVRPWSTPELVFELASAHDTTSPPPCNRVIDARTYRDQVGGSVTVTALCDGPVVSARTLDLHLVVRAGRSLVDEVR